MILIEDIYKTVLHTSDCLLFLPGFKHGFTLMITDEYQFSAEELRAIVNGPIVTIFLPNKRVLVLNGIDPLRLVPVSKIVQKLQDEQQYNALVCNSKNIEVIK